MKCSVRRDSLSYNKEIRNLRLCHKINRNHDQWESMIHTICLHRPIHLIICVFNNFVLFSFSLDLLVIIWMSPWRFHEFLHYYKMPVKIVRLLPIRTPVGNRYALCTSVFVCLFVCFFYGCQLSVKVFLCFLFCSVFGWFFLKIIIVFLHYYCRLAFWLTIIYNF